MRNPHDIEAVHEESFDSHLGFGITVTQWSDGQWTAWIAKREPIHGAERVIMDNDITWDVRPDESDLHTYIEEVVYP